MKVLLAILLLAFSSINAFETETEDKLRFLQMQATTNTIGTVQRDLLTYTPEEYTRCINCINACWGSPILAFCQKACWAGACYAYCHNNPMKPCPNNLTFLSE